MSTTIANNNATGSHNNIDKKKSKQHKKKEQKKRQKLQKRAEEYIQQNKLEQQQQNGNGNHKEVEDEIEYTNDDSELFEIDESDPTFELYSKLLKHFDNPNAEQEEDTSNTTDQQQQEETSNDKDDQKNDDTNNDIDHDGEEDDQKKKKMSNRERKRQQKLNLPILKQLVDRPDIVEFHDTNSPNPSFLISLKSLRNTVPVPSHWSQKRKYLAGKRGYVKPPFELPDFIAATGITKLRDALLEKEEEKKTKAKQRDRVRPKMRRMDIDYQVLREAFFVHQTKPKLTTQGDLYYEGKEFEVNLKKMVPGQMSEELRRALGMMDGAPPPWLPHMQIFGPPPSYPGLKLPGVNAPIPEGAQFGPYPAWGKPPQELLLLLQQMQQQGIQANSDRNNNVHNGNPIEREKWGELLPEEEVVEDEQPQQQQQQDDESSEQQLQQQTDEEIQDGISSIPSGLETPDTVDIKKRREQQQIDQTSYHQPKQLYQVIEQSSRTMGGGMMESNYKYNLPNIRSGNVPIGSVGKGVGIIKSQKSAPVEITLDPSEIEDIGEDLLKKKYEQTLQQQQPSYGTSGDDYSDLIDQETKKRKSKLNQQQQKDDKLKKFKF